MVQYCSYCTAMTPCYVILSVYAIMVPVTAVMAPVKKQGLDDIDYLRIGAWNVRSMRHKEEELAEEMRKYRLDILGVSKTHLLGVVRSKSAGQRWCFQM